MSLFKKDIPPCITENKEHSWNPWVVISRLICKNWGTYHITQQRECKHCGFTEIKRDTLN